MKRPRFNTVVCLAPTMLLIVAVQHCARAAPALPVADRVVISLLPTVSSSHAEVSIGDIARVDTADPALKQLIQSLDIAAAPLEGESTAITPRRIEFRLRLAGLDARDVSIRGQQAIVKGRRIPASQASSRQADEPAIRSTAFTQSVPSIRRAASAEVAATDEPLEILESIEDTIAAAARKAILAQLPWPEENIGFQLAQPISREARMIDPTAITRCTAQIRASGPPVGRVHVDVTLKVDGQAPLVVPVALDVRHYENVVSTVRPLARGKPIQREDLYVHRWDVTGSTDYCTKPEQLVGRRATRALPAIQIVREVDLEQAGDGIQTTGVAGPIVVKQRDRVDMIVRAGGMSITTKGEALQQGRVGDIIQLQNADTRAPVRGKVISSNEVEISP